ncbi:MAG: acyl-CoA dehydrogenase family protein [Pseudomonadota bacterium]
MSNALEFTAEQSMILESAREFCRDQSPITQVRALLDSTSGFNRDVWQAMADLGWLGLAIPEKFGGAGMSIGSVVPLAESMGRAMLATPFFSTTLAAQALLRAGTVAQQEAWLPKLATGTIATVALADGGDWGVEDSQCLAQRAGDSLLLTGTKAYVPDVESATLILVQCQLDGQPALVLLENQGLRLDANTLLDQTKRAASLTLDAFQVADNALMDPGRTSAALRDIRLLGALLVAAESTGSTAACLDTVVDYLKTRKQFGQLIGSYQALKHPTVEMLNAMDAARSLIYHAGTVVDEGPLDRDAEIACRMAKAQASEALAFAGDRAVQFHGGMGFTYECDAQLYIRRAQHSQQLFGDPWHHRKRLGSLLLDDVG